MKQVKRFRVYTVAKIMGVIYGMMGLLLIPVALIISAASLSQMNGANAFGGVVGGIMLAVVGPIFYGAAGFVVGGLSAWLYNKVADKVGGIEVLLEDVQEQRSAEARA